MSDVYSRGKIRISHSIIWENQESNWCEIAANNGTASSFWFLPSLRVPTVPVCNPHWSPQIHPLYISYSFASHQPTLLLTLVLQLRCHLGQVARTNVG